MSNSLKRTEHGEQVAVIQWKTYNLVRWPELRMLFAIANAGGYTGGFRKNVGRVMQMKAEGVVNGVPDLQLAIPRGSFHGLFIELKVKPNSRPTNNWIGSPT